jgi:hypothetical protein
MPNAISVKCPAAGLLFAALGTLSQTVSANSAGTAVTLKGELIDTWCYVSQVMGSQSAVIGTSHHVCAVWCAAGGIPVGLLDRDSGEMYIILSVGNDGVGVANDKLLNMQTHEITVNGRVFPLDGLNYLTIDEVVEDHGIVNLTHEKFGIIPGEARP